MKLADLIAGNRISIQVDYTNADHEFETTVLGNIDDTLIIAGVFYGTRALRMPDKGGINIVFQMLNQLYIWKNVTMETLFYKGRIFYRIKDTDLESRPYNRRGAFRLNLDFETSVGVSRNGSFMEEKVLLKDISESGACFTSVNPIDIKTPVRVYYESDEGVFDMTGKITRSSFDENRHEFVYGCKMDEFNATLGNFIMKEQMRRRRISA